ncbi:MAG: T9SS type A sorting domain-containing protein [Ignavibacteriales bacterium]|nr:T9SS type A sorting domain-containing protein [Ignavibacteriales bacterium]
MNYSSTAFRFTVVCIVVLTFYSVSTITFAQQSSQMAGAPAGTVSHLKNSVPSSLKKITKATRSARTNTVQYTTTTYTFSDITIFSYFDSTDVIITNSIGDTVGVAWMRADTLYSISPGTGIYSISGNKTFSVLIGDAITNYVNGYFALNESGRGVSTKFNTWMMLGGGFDPHFIVFAYEDGTQYTIKNLQTGAFVYAGSLNDGQYLDFPNVASIERQALQVTSNKPVSVLSYTDQDYYVPSSNGNFAGTLFYGFSGYYWENSITVTSYAENNHVLITNLATGDTIADATLGLWQVKTIGIYQDTFWKIVSTGTVTAANIPFAGWTGSYYYMARSADSTGTNTGRAYVIPAIASTISISSYDDNNRVKVTLLGDTTYPYTSPSLVADTLLQSGKGYIFNSNYGNNVYRIEGTGRVSVLQCNGSAGADFMPLGYALNLPDLAISQSDISFTPPDSVYRSGDKIQIGVTVYNYGTLDVSDVLVVLYDGNPDAGTPPSIGSFVAPLIPAGGNYTKTISYIVPVNAKYHNIYVRVDPNNSISESNESNNTSFRPLKSNQDLLPPLSVYVTAPEALELLGSVLTPNPFTVHADIFNTGTVSADGVHIQLLLFNGLEADSGSVDTTIASLAAQTTLGLDWKINAKKDSSGLNLYTISISGTNVVSKDVNRAILVPDIIPPAKPTGLTLTMQVNSKVMLTWTQNAEKDLAGYKIYYSSDFSFAGTEANEGPSPVSVSTLDTAYLTGLTGGTTYRFKISAIDLSNNESAYSDTVAVQTTIAGVSRDQSTIPTSYALNQNFPNPFNPSTTIKFDLPKTGFTTLKIYNMLGQEIATLVNDVKLTGRYTVQWNGSNMTSGLYFYKLISGEFIQVKKMQFIK